MKWLQSERISREEYRFVALHKLFNTDLGQYINRGESSGSEVATWDLAIIEFDDHGTFWNLDQLESTLDLIDERNRETESGILVIVYAH